MHEFIVIGRWFSISVLESSDYGDQADSVTAKSFEILEMVGVWEHGDLQDFHCAHVVY
jgi:hypothetical protein